MPKRKTRREAARRGLPIPSGTFILKVQAPLEANTPNAPVLAYNRNRSVQQFLPFDEFWQKALHGRQKAYFMAQAKDKRLGIGQEAPAQDW